jgi:ribosomal protein L35AE/L33A
MSDIINIDQFETVENIEISVFPTYNEINVNRITGGGGSGAVNSVNGQVGDVVLTKSNLGLGNVDNTSDANKPISSATQTALDLKVDKVTGKGLSTNDYTTIEKTKLSGIQDGAEANVNADWNATTGDAVILNKPTIPSAVTQTSQLTNNGADGINPFITALDIPTAGQASTLVREVKNMTGATLTKGTVVYISGANGNKALVSKALATTDALSSRTFGLLQSDILNNGLGNCVIIGDLSGLDTSAFTEGAQLYLSGTVAGTYTETKILAPTHLVYVGKVTRVHPTQGQIEVGIQNGYEISEIHDVQINTPLDNQALIYETSTDLWKNKTIIQDSITDGVTAIAPSQNAVFDALALKQNILSYTPYKFIQTSQTVYTGTVAETVVATATINGNTFNSSDVMKILFKVTKSNTATLTMRIKINTTNTLLGATQIAIFNTAIANTYALMTRTFDLQGGNLYGYNFNSLIVSDMLNTNTAGNSTAYNTANTLFLFFTIQSSTVSDTITPNLCNITN